MNKTHYVYKITNTVNNKFYVGVHYGYVDDSYMGSGKLIKQAVEKYGKECFIKEILAEFDNALEAFNYETNLIQTEKLYENKDSYNLSPNHNSPGNALGGVTYEMLYGEEKAAELRLQKSQRAKGRVVSEKTRKLLSAARKGNVPWNKGLTMDDPRVQLNVEKSKETKQLNPPIPWNKGITGDVYKQHYKSGLTPPSMTGRMWINNGVEQRKIMKTDSIPEGWVNGRCDNKGDNNPMRKKQNENQIN